jgi:hypothetical protein
MTRRSSAAVTSWIERGGGEQTGNQQCGGVRIREVGRGCPRENRWLGFRWPADVGFQADRILARACVPTWAACPGKGPRSRRDIRFPKGPLDRNSQRRIISKSRKYFWDAPYLFKLDNDEVMRRCVPREEKL